MATELELQVQPEDVAALLASHDQTFFLANEHSRLLLKMESTCDKDLVSGVLDHYVDLIDTVVAGFERTDISFVKFYSGYNTIKWYSILQRNRS